MRSAIDERSVQICNDRPNTKDLLTHTLNEGGPAIADKPGAGDGSGPKSLYPVPYSLPASTVYCLPSTLPLAPHPIPELAWLVSLRRVSVPANSASAA